MPARPALAVVAVALVVAAPHAFAQSASVQAQSLFDDGRALIKAGKIAEACTAFESSQKLDPAVTTLLNLAECREQNHQLATAWGAFVEANRMARASNNNKLARVSTSHARKLEPRLSKLTIAVPADRQISGLEVLRDKDPINPASWNHALPIDGGTYTIVARAPGRTPWTATQTIKVEGDLVVVEIPKLEPAAPPVTVSRATTAGKTEPAPPVPPTASKPAAPPPVAPPRAASPPATAGPAPPLVPPLIDRPPDPRGRRSLVAPIALGAAAVALGGTAIVFEVKGRNLYDQAKGITDASRQAERDDKESSANSRHKVAQGLGVAALGCAGVAVYLLVRGGEDRASATAIAPLVSPGLAGLAVAGRW